MTTRIKVDFYRIVDCQGVFIPFEEILQSLSKLPSEKKYQDLGAYPAYLYQLDYTSDSMWEGEVVRLRMHDNPVKGNRECRVEEISLGDDEGIGEQTAFLYHPQTRILVFQVNHYGISLPNFIKYFERASGNKDLYRLDPVLQPDAMIRLNSMKYVYEFNVSVAGLKNKAEAFTKEPALTEFLSLSESYDSPNISVKLSVGRKKKKNWSLDVAKVIETVKTMSLFGKNPIKNIKISGASEDSEQIFVDILKDKMRETIDIKTSDKRNIPYMERKQALREGWSRRKNEILKFFG